MTAHFGGFMAHQVRVMFRLTMSWHRVARADPASCLAAQVTLTLDSHLLPPSFIVKLNLSEGRKEEEEGREKRRDMRTALKKHRSLSHQDERGRRHRPS